jgi:hypothetical protein
VKIPRSAPSAGTFRQARNTHAIVVTLFLELQRLAIHRAQAAAVVQPLYYVGVPTQILHSIAVSLIVMRRFFHVGSPTAVSYCAFHTVFPVFI